MGIGIGYIPGGSIISQTARGAQKAFERLTDNDWDWDEGGEAVRKVFEFEVEERVYKTEGERLEEHRRKEVEEEEEEIVKEKKKEKESAKEVKKSGGWDLRNLVGAKEGSKMKPSKTVGVDRADEINSSNGTSTAVPKGLEERLGRIEDALEILLTEMVRNRRSADGKIEGTSGGASTKDI